MRVLNRTAVTIVAAKPYVDWTLTRDADFAKGAITVVRVVDVGEGEIEGEDL